MEICADWQPYYIERAVGGNTPRLRAVDAKVAELETSRFSGADARFLIEERSSRSEVYNITAVNNGREDYQRLVLSPVTRDAGMTSTDKSGSWTTFEIIVSGIVYSGCARIKVSAAQLNFLKSG